MNVVRVVSITTDGGKGLRAGTIDFEGFIATKFLPRTRYFNLKWDYYLKVRSQFVEDFMSILGKVRNRELSLVEFYRQEIYGCC